MKSVQAFADVCAAAVLAFCGMSDAEGDEAMKAKETSVVHRALGAGRWFPGARAQLSAMVDGFVGEAAPPAFTGRAVAVIAPHAGYVYSGRVAGYSFRALRESWPAEEPPETVVILGFSHRSGFRGVALMDGDAIETPLGTALLDAAAAKRLAERSGRIVLDYAPHAGEHSAENQIPFVQRALPDARLVVALIGDHDAATRTELVAALKDLAGRRRIAVVASTDLLHDPDYDAVARTDAETLKRMVELDAPGLARAWTPSRQVCCGLAPVLTAMEFARGQGCGKGVLLYGRNSGDDFPEGRGQWVVGYGAVAFPVTP